MHRWDEHVRDLRERVPRVVAARVALEDMDDVEDDLLGLADDERVDEGASGRGFENVSGPPATTKGCCSSRSSRSGGIPAASSMRRKPAISPS